MFIYPDTCRAQLFKFLLLVVHMERYLFPLPIYHHQMKKCKILFYVNKTLHFQSRLPLWSYIVSGHVYLIVTNIRIMAKEFASWGSSIITSLS